MDLIDARQLRAFQLLAETGSFTEAAKRMYVTQSAVSHSTKALETALDCKLLERGGKKVALTTAGEVLLRRADRILNEMHRATNEIQALSKWGYGRLRVGATNTMCEHLIPKALRGLKDEVPNAVFSVQAADTHELMEWLDMGEIDVAVAMGGQNEDTRFHFRPLFTDQLVFVVAPDHPWAEAGVAPEEELQDQRYIIYSRKSSTFRLIERGFRKLGIRLSSTMELGNMLAIKELAKVGLGVGLVSPWLASAEIQEGSLIKIDIPGEAVEREWGLFSRKAGETAGLTGEAFVGMCRRVVSELGMGGELAPAEQVKMVGIEGDSLS